MEEIECLNRLSIVLEKKKGEIAYWVENHNNLQQLLKRYTKKKSLLLIFIFKLWNFMSLAYIYLSLLTGNLKPHRVTRKKKV